MFVGLWLVLCRGAALCGVLWLGALVEESGAALPAFAFALGFGGGGGGRGGVAWRASERARACVG